MPFPRNPTRPVRVGAVTIGGGAPISVQTMCVSRTHDVPETLAEVEVLARAGADIIRVAVDSGADARALPEIRARTQANLAVDLQENFPIAEMIAPYVDKIRYNPGHLHHRFKDRSVREKVAMIARAARDHGCAIRIGVNCGSVDPDYKERFKGDEIAAMVDCALDHAAILDDLGFTNYVVSLKDSDPRRVVEANVRFAAERPDVPLHLGVTEAGLPPDGIIKTRIALEQLIPQGIGDTIRVSLTVPKARKVEEIEAGRQILADMEAGRFLSVPDLGGGLNIIACPGCARVENERFVELAENVRSMTEFARKHDLTIAVMGCRVNGPGETDDADLGLWCGPAGVNLKRRSTLIGEYPYEDILDRLLLELDRLIEERAGRRREDEAGG